MFKKLKYESKNGEINYRHYFINENGKKNRISKDSYLEGKKNKKQTGGLTPSFFDQINKFYNQQVFFKKQINTKSKIKVSPYSLYEFFNKIVNYQEKNADSLKNMVVSINLKNLQSFTFFGNQYTVYLDPIPQNLSLLDITNNNKKIKNIESKSTNKYFGYQLLQKKDNNNYIWIPVFIIYNVEKRNKITSYLLNPNNDDNDDNDDNNIKNSHKIKLNTKTKPNSNSNDYYRPVFEIIGYNIDYKYFGKKEIDIYDDDRYYNKIENANITGIYGAQVNYLIANNVKISVENINKIYYNPVDDFKDPNYNPGDTFVENSKSPRFKIPDKNKGFGGPPPTAPPARLQQAPLAAPLPLAPSQAKLPKAPSPVGLQQAPLVASLTQPVPQARLQQREPATGLPQTIPQNRLPQKIPQARLQQPALQTRLQNSVPQTATQPPVTNQQPYV